MSSYDRFRRRIAPVAFALALGFIAYDTCQKQERTEATIVLDFGDVEPTVRAVEAEIWMDGDPVTTYRREAQPGGLLGPARFDTSLPGTEGELRLTVDLGDGDQRQITRNLHVREGATMTVRLEHDLR